MRLLYGVLLCSLLVACGDDDLPELPQETTLSAIDADTFGSVCMEWNDAFEALVPDDATLIERFCIDNAVDPEAAAVAATVEECEMSVTTCVASFNALSAEDQAAEVAFLRGNFFSTRCDDLPNAACWDNRTGGELMGAWEAQQQWAEGVLDSDCTAAVERGAPVDFDSQIRLCF